MHRQRKTIEQHLKDLRSKHGDRYEYPVHKWKQDLSSTDVVEIICKVHGSFFMKLSDHKRGYNCPQCAKIEGYKKRRETSIEKFKQALPNNITLDCFDWETREALLMCSKHGPIIKKIRSFNEVPNICRHCMLEARQDKKEFISKHGLASIMDRVSAHLCNYSVEMFQKQLSKATHIGAYVFVHTKNFNTITLTLTEIKEIYYAKTLF